MPTFADRLRRLATMAVKHRVKIFDIGFILVGLAVAALFAFEMDIFIRQGQVSLAEETLELDELMVLVTLTLCGALVYTWRRAREHQRENTRRQAAEKEVLSLALHDPLTGLPNRRQFDEALKGALAAPPTAPMAHAVFLLDLNGFKKINDLHGHPVGDEVLIHVGSRLLRAVREGDLVARLGGDEFAILARNLTGEEAATTIALRIIEGLSQPVHAGGANHNVGTAIGIALSPQDGILGEDLIRKADVALYRAKSEGTSALRFFEPEMDARLRERDMLERALAEAIQADALTVRFQPSVDAASGKVTAFEALPFWVHPTLGELGPERFLPIADGAGLLSTATDQLLRKACLAATNWPNDVRLAFDIAAAQLKDMTFGLRLLRILSETRLAPRRLDLEVDEGALIRDADAARTLLGPLRQAGVSVVADHFGTGYSDLQNLHKLQLDSIKIDPSFIAAMTHDRKAAVMVRALIGIGKGLDLSVIADGVTTEEQRAALQSEGCEQFQGCLYSDSVTADAAMALVAAPKTRSSAA